MDDHPVVHGAHRDAGAYAKSVGKDLPTKSGSGQPLMASQMSLNAAAFSPGRSMQK
jgi:hypothetical protein